MSANSPLSNALSILQRPQNKARLLRFIQDAIDKAEADKQRAEAERRFVELEGERASYETEIEKCRADSVHWFNHWTWTYDPRLVGKILAPGQAPATGFVPFKLWPIQEKFVRFVEDHIARGKPFLVEKSRDMGASYITTGLALHRWLFVPGFKTSFGSRDEDLVDSRDNADSLFEKIRIMLRRLPAWMLPEGFTHSRHDTMMSLFNPATGAAITGEGGDQMGRGGRNSWYVVDEAAFVARAEKVERAISGNADCVGWLSTVNGPGGMFYRKRHTMPPEDIFVLDYHDDPRMTPERIAAKKSSMESHAWASEYERDYAASVEGVCIPATWVQAARRLAKVEPNLVPSNNAVGGLDVGAGKAKSVFIARRGPVVDLPQRRAEADTTGTAHWALDLAETGHVTTLNFDEPGVGLGVSSTLLHNPLEGLAVVAVNTGNPPSDRLWPDGKSSVEKFGNLKAELWWLARAALQRTYEHVQFIETHGEQGQLYPIDELIALPEDFALEAQLSLPKWFKNERGKIVIEKKEALRARRVSSPDEADAFVLTFLEPPEATVTDMSFDFDDLKTTNPWTI